MEYVSTVFVSPKTVLVSIAAAILFFFGIIFALATNYWPTGLIVSAMFFVVAFAAVYFISAKPSTQITQKLEVSGDMKAVALKCPNCGASVDAKQIKIVSGVPYATCPYCGHTFEVTEEPKW